MVLWGSGMYFDFHSEGSRFEPGSGQLYPLYLLSGLKTSFLQDKIIPIFWLWLLNEIQFVHSQLLFKEICTSEILKINCKT